MVEVLNFLFIAIMYYILPLILMVVLLVLFILVTILLCKVAAFCYQFVYKMSRYVLTPVRCLWQALERKNCALTRFFTWLQTSRRGNIATIVLVSVLFVSSVFFLLAEGLASGDLWFFLSNDFPSSLPVASGFSLLLLGDSLSSFGQIMIETTITSLCLYYVNKKVAKASVAKRTLYNFAFIFIGWAAGQAISKIDFEGLSALLFLDVDHYWFHFIDDFLLTRIIYCVVVLVALILILYTLLVAAVLALREVVAPIAFTVAGSAALVLLVTVAPDIYDKIYTPVLVLLFVFYEIWRVVSLQEWEADWDKKVDSRLENIGKSVKNAIATVTGLLRKKK